MAKKKFTPAQLVERYDKLKADKETWSSVWQELTDYFLPRKNDVTQTLWPGQKRQTHLFDNSGIMANKLLGGFLQGILTNPNTFWFGLTTGNTDMDDQDDVREYMQEVVTIMHNTMNNSNFQTEVHEMYLDLGSVGTGAMFILEDDDLDIRYDANHISKVTINENHKGQVDEIHREFKWDARQIIAEYGSKNVHPDIQKAFQSNIDDKFDIVQSIYPEDVEASSRRWISQHILKEKRFELREAKFTTFPAVVPRWAKATNEKYGRGPGHEALAEIKMLNKMAEITMRGAQKTIDPPMQAPDEGLFGGKKINLRPAAINYFRSGTQDRIEPILQNTRVDFGIELIRLKSERVKDSFFVNQLQLREGPQMTATEVMQRTEEASRLMGPTLGRMQHEFLRPLIDRNFDILQKRGKLPPPPRELEGKNLDVQFSSLIARSQRTGELQSIVRAFEIAGLMGQVDPSVFDNFNPDAIIKIVSRALDLNQKALNSQAKINEMREARAQAQQAAIQQEQAQAQADIMSKAGPAMAAVQGASGQEG